MKKLSFLLALLMTVSLFASALPVAASAEELPDEATPLKPPTMWTVTYTKRAYPDDPREVPFDAGVTDPSGPIVNDGEADKLWWFNSGSQISVPILNFNRAVTVNELVLAEIFPPEWEFQGLAHSVYAPFSAYEKLTVWYADGDGENPGWQEVKIKGGYTDTSDGFQNGLEDMTSIETYEHIGNIHIVFEEPITACSFMIFGEGLGSFELCVSTSSLFSYCVYGPGYLPATVAPETEPPATDEPAASSSDGGMTWLYVTIGAVALAVVVVIVIVVAKKKKK